LNGRGRLEEGKKGPRKGVGFVWLWPSQSTAALAITDSRLSLGQLPLALSTHQSQSAIPFAFHGLYCLHPSTPLFIIQTHAPSVRQTSPFSGLPVATSDLITRPRLCVNIHVKECVCVLLSHVTQQRRIVTSLLHVTTHVVPFLVSLPYLNHRKLGRRPCWCWCWRGTWPPGLAHVAPPLFSDEPATCLTHAVNRPSRASETGHQSGAVCPYHRVRAFIDVSSPPMWYVFNILRHLICSCQFFGVLHPVGRALRGFQLLRCRWQVRWGNK
jgi:hypothetical protein